MEYLIGHHRLRAVGVDPSSVLLGYGRRRGPCLPLVLRRRRGSAFCGLGLGWGFCRMQPVRCEGCRPSPWRMFASVEGGRVANFKRRIQHESRCQCHRLLPAVTLPHHWNHEPGRADQNVECLRFSGDVLGRPVSDVEGICRSAHSVQRLAPQCWCSVDHGEGNGEEFPTTFKFAAGVKPGYFLCLARKR